MVDAATAAPTFVWSGWRRTKPRGRAAPLGRFSRMYVRQSLRRRRAGTRALATAVPRAVHDLCVILDVHSAERQPGDSRARRRLAAALTSPPPGSVCHGGPCRPAWATVAPSSALRGRIGHRLAADVGIAEGRRAGADDIRGRNGATRLH